MRFSHLAVSAAVLTAGIVALSRSADAVGVGGNSPPVCTAPSVQVVECNNEGSPTIAVLDVGAVDPDGDPLTYAWNLTGSCLLGQGTIDDPTLANPSVRFNMNGTCFAECGGITVSVSDGINPPVICPLALMIGDTTGPMITAPPDVLELWTTGYPTQTSQAVQGTATATDNCDANPTVNTIVDDHVYGVPPSGIEVVVTRTWEAVDCAGLTAQATQTITLVGPSFFNESTALADLGPGSCPNVVDVTGTGAVELVVFGGAGFDPALLRPRTISFRRADGAGGLVTPVGVLMGDFGTPLARSACHSQDLDGVDDAMLIFDQSQVVAALGLAGQADHSVFEIQIAGTLADGSPFLTKEVLQVGQ